MWALLAVGLTLAIPASSERLTQAENLIAEEGWRDRKSQKPFRVEYQVRNGEFVKHR